MKWALEAQGPRDPGTLRWVSRFHWKVVDPSWTWRCDDHGDLTQFKGSPTNDAGYGDMLIPLIPLISSINIHHTGDVGQILIEKRVATVGVSGFSRALDEASASALESQVT